MPFKLVVSLLEKYQSFLDFGLLDENIGTLSLSEELEMAKTDAANNPDSQESSNHGTKQPLVIQSQSSYELTKMNSNKAPLMTEEIEEQNLLSIYFSDVGRNKVIAKNLTEIFNQSIIGHLKDNESERKEIFDALVLQVLKAITPENLKFFVSDSKIIEDLIKKTSQKYHLELLEVLIKVADIQKQPHLQELIWSQYSSYFFDKKKNLQEALVSLLRFFDQGNTQI